MNRFDMILVILTPAMCLFSLIVLPWMYFIYQPIKFLVSVALVAICIVMTLVLLIKRRYRVSDMLNILIASIFSLAGYSILIFGAFRSFNIVTISFEVILTVVGFTLSFMRLGKNPPQERQKEDEPAYETTDEEIRIPSTTYPEPSRRKGSIRRTLRVWRSPILYFVTFSVVGIIAMFIYRPIPAGNDILTNIAMGIGFGFLFACCLIGSGRTKFVRE